MRILNVVGAFPPAFAEGGPGIMAHSLSLELIRLGHDVFVLTTDKCGQQRLDVPAGDTAWQGVPVRYCRWQRSLLPYHSADLQAQVRARAAQADVVLLSSSWTSYGVATGFECRRAGIPYILYAHGSYDPVRLRHGGFKKRLWWWFLDRHLYWQAAAVIALTAAEVRQVQAMGIRTRIEQIPIGVNITQLTSQMSRRELEARFPALQGRSIVLFLGRVHPIKGVDVLVRAFARVYARVPSALLVIAGAGEDGYAGEVLALARSLGVGDAVLLTGEVRTPYTATLLREAAVFALTSLGEGLPATALEAMYCRTPVVLSEGCNLSVVEEAGAGYVVSREQEVADAIVELLQDGHRCREMGKRGRYLVDEQFTWARVAAKTADLCWDILSVQ